MTNHSLALLQLAANHTARPAPGQSRRRSAVKSSRNLTIFKKVEIEQFTHEEVDQRFNLHRSRITQIVKQVRAELAQASADDPEIQDHQARHRLDQKLEQLRLECALEAAAKAMRRDPQRLITNRAGSRAKGDSREGWSETVTRDVAPNVQTIKTFLRVAQDLGKLRDRNAKTNPTQEKLTLEALLDAICAALEDFFMRATNDDDPPSNEFIRLVEQFRVKLFTWVIRRRQGIPRAEAWSSPTADQRAAKPLSPSSAASVSRTAPSHYASRGDCANHGPPQINSELTAPIVIGGGTTCNASTT